jgi:hypothetical protein
VNEWNGVPSTKKYIVHILHENVLSEKLFTFSTSFHHYPINDDIVVSRVRVKPEGGEVGGGHSPMKGPRMKG